MNDHLFKIKMAPGDSPLGDGGGGSIVPEASDPVLNSTAGLSAEQLSAPLSVESDAGDLGEPALTPADPNAAAATAQPAAQAVAAQQAATIRDAARHYGLDLSQYEDDGQAFAALVQMANQARQSNYYADLGRSIAPHYEIVQQAIQQRQQSQAKPADRKPWEAPEFDERWMNLVDKDPKTGMFVALPGAPPWVAEKVQAYADHLDQWTTSLARSPMDALGPLVKHVAEELLTQRFGQVQAQQQAQAIVAENESWLYQTDAHGRRLTGHDGKYLPTPLGARYYTHLQTLKASGVNDARTLDSLAKQLLQADIYATNAGKATATAAAATPQAVAAVSRHNVNPGQAVPAPRRQVVAGTTEPSAEGLSLRERMRLDIEAAGVTDADLMATFSHDDD
jgi:hypothetical protein